MGGGIGMTGNQKKKRVTGWTNFACHAMLMLCLVDVISRGWPKAWHCRLCVCLAKPGSVISRDLIALLVAAGVLADGASGLKPTRGQGAADRLRAGSLGPSAHRSQRVPPATSSLFCEH